MTETSGVRNELSGQTQGPVVQAGSIHRLQLTTVAEAVPRVVPRQLPLAIQDFTGRAEHLAALDAQLSRDVAAGALVITAVDGTAGVGKTALALQWAHRVQHLFPDGTLYTDLGGYGPGEPAAPGEALAGFLGALGTPQERIPTRLDAQAGLYRSMLADRRVLVVLDNAHTAAQVRPLLPGGPGCQVVVTSRASMIGLVAGEGATRVCLDLLSWDEATELVRRVLGEQRAKAEPEAVTELVRACGRLPLALRIVAARAAASPHTRLAETAADLTSDSRRWDTLSLSASQHTAVKTVLGWSYRQLTPAQARLFRRLGLHPGPEISRLAAMAVADLAPAEVRQTLQALVDGHLLALIAPDRYRMHDLLRAYAADLAARDEPKHDRDRARRDIVEWYAHNAKAAHDILVPGQEDWLAGADLQTHTDPEISFADRSQAWAWCQREQVNLAAATRAAAQHGSHRLTALLADLTGTCLAWMGHWDEVFALCQIGLTAVRAYGDRAAECHLLATLGNAHRRCFRWQAADEALRAALALAVEVDRDNQWLRAALLHDLGTVCLGQFDYAAAEALLRQALPLSRGGQQGHLEGLVEVDLSAACTGLGDYEQAFQHAARGLALYRGIGDLGGEALALHAMARARQHTGDHSEAIALCQQALTINLEHHYPPAQTAGVLDALGTSMLDTGQTDQGLHCLRQALDIYDELADHRARDLRTRLETHAGNESEEP